jgi:ABC-type nitrate/sulfonate/bicarbonate transport system substrate-binding protein
MKLRLALDWTPNINHIGFFIAQDKGWYQQQGIELIIEDPSQDNYKYTPAKKIELGKADLALCPLESIISYRTKSAPFDMRALASIWQHDLSAIVVKKSSHISRPKQLDGKIYASYKAKYEDAIVRKMITNDGGQGDLHIVYPDKLNIWDELLNDKVDATWIFLNWEGVAVEQSNSEMQYFNMRDFEIPYSYSPVIATSKKTSEWHSSALDAFLKATKKGFLYAFSEPDVACEILSKYLPEHDRHIDLLTCIEVSKKCVGDNDNWGIMEAANVNKFCDWLYQQKLEPKKFCAEEVLTNQHLY